jgi:hypothetical protein
LPDNVVWRCSNKTPVTGCHRPRIAGTGQSEKISAALAVIDPDINRQDWFAIGCALFNELGDEGFAI